MSKVRGAKPLIGWPEASIQINIHSSVLCDWVDVRMQIRCEGQLGLTGWGAFLTVGTARLDGPVSSVCP